MRLPVLFTAGNQFSKPKRTPLALQKTTKRVPIGLYNELPKAFLSTPCLIYTGEFVLNIRPAIFEVKI